MLQRLFRELALIPPRILIVEDEAIVAADLRRRLGRMGYEVVGVADNGADAIDLVERTQPTFVFMDIVIQGPIDGVETAIALRSRWDVPVVFLTAHADLETVRRTKHAGPYGYLVKPFEDRELQTMIEITSSRHALEAQARILRQAFMCAGSAAALVDAKAPNAPIVDHNTAFEALFGVVPPIDSFSLWAALDLEDSVAAVELRAAAAGLRAGRATVRVKRRAGPPIWAEVIVRPVHDRAEVVTHLLWTVLDVTARRQAEEALLQAQKMEAVGHVTGGIAHDFNNIMSVILTCASFAHDALAEGDPIREDLREVLDAAVRAAALTRQLLTFSQQRPSAKRPIDAAAQVSSFESMIRRSVGETIAVSVQAPSERLVVQMDPVQFDQVLLNLAINARDAMPAGGALRIELSAPSPSVVRVEVSDTGCGMDEATLARAFDAFFTTKAAGLGTGLGLATCASIVEDAGGLIRVDSQPGAGTVFTVDLPRLAESAAATHEAEPPVESGRGRRVLVVEDDEALRRATARILVGSGYEVFEATDGEHAVRWMVQGGATLDAILTDVTMPGLSGLDVVSRARELAPQAGVLMVTGYTCEADLRGMERAEMLWKPFSRAGLLAAVANACARSRMIRMRRCSTVLFVEDDPCMRHAIGRVLQSAGYDVVLAGSVDEARAVLTGGCSLGAVICDLHLRDGTGLDLFEHLCAHHPDLADRVAILTGRPTPELLASKVVVLTKPVPPETLLDQIGELMLRPARVELS